MPSVQEQIEENRKAIEALKLRVDALEATKPKRPEFKPEFGPGHGEDS